MPPWIPVAVTFGLAGFVISFIALRRSSRWKRLWKATVDALRGASARRDRTVQVRKLCIVPGCSGTMTFHERSDEAHGPHTLEWPWYASWVCERDSTHFQVIGPAEE